MAKESFEVWRQILADTERLKTSSLSQLFNGDKSRGQMLTKTLSDGQSEIIVDFSKQLIDQIALKDLLALAKQGRVLEKFAEMRSGAKVNFTEGEPALHTALRARSTDVVTVDGKNVVRQVHDELSKIQAFTEKVRREKKFKKIVNIGIGGSDLGPALIYDALQTNQEPDIECLFVANFDSTEINLALAKCKPHETLFIVSSKSFSTAETLANAQIATRWLAKGLGVQTDDHQVADQFVVVSANLARAGEVGVVAANSFQIWPWVGGRYSISSAVSLAPIIAFGYDVFVEFLSGMRSVDEQMQNTLPEDNATLILGLIDVFNFGTRRFSSQAILTYASALRSLPSYLQQLIMESNGKSVRHDGSPTIVATAPVVWGGTGTNSQHAFMQMLHQGSETVPVDFIGFAQLANVDISSHDALVANMLAQAKAMAFGGARDEVGEDSIEVHRAMPGNRPSTTLLAQSLTPRTLGALIAMYEHRVFVHGVIAQINSFDQWGVELGKTLSLEIEDQIVDESEAAGSSDQSGVNDTSTKRLIHSYRQMRRKK